MYAINVHKENITEYKKALFFCICVNHANMYINAYEAKCNRVSLKEKKCWLIVNETKNGIMVVEKWSDDNEYSSPLIELVLCPHATWHES